MSETPEILTRFGSAVTIIDADDQWVTIRYEDGEESQVHLGDLRSAGGLPEILAVIDAVKANKQTPEVTLCDCGHQDDKPIEGLCSNCYTRGVETVDQIVSDASDDFRAAEAAIRRDFERTVYERADAEDAAEHLDDTSGFERPCDDCGGTGYRKDPSDGYMKPCATCDGLGLWSPEGIIADLEQALEASNQQHRKLIAENATLWERLELTTIRLKILMQDAVKTENGVSVGIFSNIGAAIINQTIADNEAALLAATKPTDNGAPQTS